MPIALDKQDCNVTDLPSPIAPTVVTTSTNNSDTQEPINIPITIDAVTDDADEIQNRHFYTQNLATQQLNLTDGKKGKLQLDITTPCGPSDNLKQSQSNELLTYDTQSLDGFITPDDGSLLGLSNINYDIDLSDLSADNSAADELTPEKRKSPSFPADPFSPIGVPCNISQSPLVPSPALTKSSDDTQKPVEFILPFKIENDDSNPLDKPEENTSANLPSPIKPHSSHYSGFSMQGVQIPSIPCNTGDFNSLNLLQRGDNDENSAEDANDEIKSNDDK